MMYLIQTGTWTDPRSLATIDVSEKFSKGLATKAELEGAAYAAAKEAQTEELLHICKEMENK
jgi:hypothetical protein